MVELLPAGLVILLVYAAVAAVFQAVLTPKTNRLSGAVTGVFWPLTLLAAIVLGAIDGVAKMFRSKPEEDC